MLRRAVKIFTSLLPSQAARRRLSAYLAPKIDRLSPVEVVLEGSDRSPYLALINRVHPKADVGLNRYEKNVHSQFGEDGILEHIFSVIGAKEKFAIEFGAWDGKLHSNTFNLVANHGWKALMIEGREERFGDLKRTSAEVDGRIIPVHGLVGFDRYPLLDSYLKECPAEPDMLSIDVDGIDYFIWESLKTVRPRVVVVEYMPTVPPDVIFIQARDESVNEGSSATALVELGAKKGYSLAAVTNTNLIFVNDKEYAKLGIACNDLEALWHFPSKGRVFHVFSGKIYTAGMEKLNWTGETVKPDSLQLRSDFSFPDALE